MNKLLIAVSAAALALGATGAIAAQSNEGGHGRGPAGMLRQADTNQDGAISSSEFAAHHDARFTQLDSNHDGSLTGEEMRAGRHWGQGRRGHRGMGLERADADHDGAITREEFLARPSAHFDRLDANDDGVIAADERPQRRERAERGERGERGEGQAGRHGFGADANQDGSVSRAEFTAAGQTMFQRLDANSDGAISADEISAMRAHHRRGPPAAE